MNKTISSKLPCGAIRVYEGTVVGRTPVSDAKVNFDPVG